MRDLGVAIEPELMVPRDLCRDCVGGLAAGALPPASRPAFVPADGLCVRQTTSTPLSTRSASRSTTRPTWTGARSTSRSFCPRRGPWVRPPSALSSTPPSVHGGTDSVLRRPRQTGASRTPRCTSRAPWPTRARRTSRTGPTSSARTADSSPTPSGARWLCSTCVARCSRLGDLRGCSSDLPLHSSSASAGHQGHRARLSRVEACRPRLVQHLRGPVHGRVGQQRGAQEAARPREGAPVLTVSLPHRAQR